MRHLLLMVLGLVSLTAHAVNEYYPITRSARAMGMGGAFYGLSDDESALFYNPAGLSLYPGKTQFFLNLNADVAADSVSSLSTISDAIDGADGIDSIASEIEGLQGKPLYGSASFMPYLLARGFGLGILAGDVKANAALLGRGVDSSLDVTAIADTGVLMGFGGRLFSKQLHFGMTNKFLYRAGGNKIFGPDDLLEGSTIQLAELGGAGGGYDFDLGMTYEIPGKGSRTAGVSVVVQNVLASNFSIARVEGAPPGLVRTASVGTFVQWKFKKAMNGVRLAADFADLSLGGETDAERGARGGSIWKHVNFGLEAPFWGWLYLRAGVHQGYWTAGLGISAYALRMDFATYGEELANAIGRLPSRRYMLRFALGFGAPSADRSPPKGKK